MWLASLLVLVMLLGGCATRTVGMQAPLAHDYDGVQWRPLDATVTQQIVVAPGYTAVVENDPGTDREMLVERIDALPDDVRSAELVEIRIALRTTPEASFDPGLTVTTSVAGASEPPVVATIDDLDFDDDWAVLTNLPFAWAGETLEIALGPAVGWEYGVTVGRVPYGGSSAFVASGGGEPQALGGSLGFETVFEQSTDRSRLLEETVGPSLWDALTDPLLVSIYAIILAGGGAVWLARMRGVRAG